jgi:hypothetical protein
MMALFYRRGWFENDSERSARSLFNRKTLTIPLLKKNKKMPVFTMCPQQRVQKDGSYVGVDFDQPASVDSMGYRLKEAARKAGFLNEGVTSYAFRYGFADHMLQKLGLPDGFVKKLMNHTPNSRYLRDCYEGDQQVDILSIREAINRNAEIELDLFGKAYVWRVENARGLTANELNELKDQLLKTDEKARGYHDLWKESETLAQTALKKKQRARWVKYSKQRDKAKSAFYSRLTILKRKKLREIRSNELEEMMSTITLKELRERAFNPPEGRQFKTRIECIE